MILWAPPSTQSKKKPGLALWMERVLEECDHASIGLLPDPVHDLRVALRRCRSLADGNDGNGSLPRMETNEKSRKGFIQKPRLASRRPRDARMGEPLGRLDRYCNRRAVAISLHSRASTQARGGEGSVGQTVPNAVLAPMFNGKQDFFNRGGTIQLIVDFFGYFGQPLATDAPPTSAALMKHAQMGMSN